MATTARGRPREPRATLEWLFAHDEAERAEALAVKLWPFWYAHGHLTEARRWLRRALDAAPHEPSETRANALMAAGYLASDQGDDDEAVRLLEPALAYAKETGAIGVAASAAALYCAVLVDPQAAFDAGHEAVALARQAGDEFVLAVALNNLGEAARNLGKRDESVTYQEESLALRRKQGDQSRIAISLCNVARHALVRGDTSGAARLFGEAAETARAIDDKRGDLRGPKRAGMDCLCRTPMARSVHANGREPAPRDGDWLQGGGRRRDPGIRRYQRGCR